MAKSSKLEEFYQELKKMNEITEPAPPAVYWKAVRKMQKKEQAEAEREESIIKMSKETWEREFDI